MNYEQIKKNANDILRKQAAECSYIEYKKSGDQLGRILKTICAYGNNYYNNDIQYIFIGVEEVNDDSSKAIPSLPVAGIGEGQLEKCRNQINSLRSFLYPNVSFEIIVNEYEGKKYLLVAVPRQTGGPFMVSDRAEKDRKINLKPGRYVRVEAESRIARVDEEYDLLRKFSNYHFSSLKNAYATIDDLNSDLLVEYMRNTSDRDISMSLDKRDIARALNLMDRNDPSGTSVLNYAVLMFTDSPDRFIPYAYTEMIIDMYGSKQKMESKTFTGPVWKQYRNIVNYINDNFLNEFVIRTNGEAENRRFENYPFTAIEELVANAIVHNNYENGKPIQIYVSEKQINIVNYNKPLPPLSVRDLNDRRFFSECDTENPELRDMFRALGIIESFGTGIGEAKRAMKNNGSPDLYYRIFSEADNVTSVVIPVNEEYLSYKTGANPRKKPGIEDESLFSEGESQVSPDVLLNAPYTEKVKRNLLKIHAKFPSATFGNKDVAELLECSETSATGYLRKLYDLGLTEPVKGAGKGKYRFRASWDK